MSTAKFNQWLNPDGTENYKCRAWVNFNGTGTVAIRASGNVSSITDNGTGDYTVNFTTAMPDANYAVTVSSGDWLVTNNTRSIGVSASSAPTSSSVRLVDMNGSAAAEDFIRAMVSIFR